MAIISNAGTIHYDKVLTNYAADYQPQEYKFINGLLLPTVPVAKQSDKYAKFSAEGRYDIKNSTRAKGTRSNKISTYFLSDDTYFCDEKSLSEDIYWQDIANADLNVEEKKKTYNVMAALMLEREYNVANLVFTAANYSAGATKSTTACAAKWDIDEYSKTNPRTELNAYKRLIGQRIGVNPNVLVINETVADGLMDSPFLQNYLSSNVDKNIDEMVLARYFQVDRVLIGKAGYNTAKEGQTVTMGGLWGKHALLAYVNPSAGLSDSSFAKTFIWNMEGRGTVGVRKWDIEDTKTTTVEAEMNYDNKIVFEDAAFLLTDIIS